MSDERPVEELIGWRQDWPNGHALAKVWFNGDAQVGKSQAGEQDLADWLRERTYSFRIEMIPLGNWDVRAVRRARANVEHYEARTIRDALVAAVRAVSETTT